MTKNSKISQDMKIKYTNVYLIRSSMENGQNKYIYKNKYIVPPLLSAKIFISLTTGFKEPNHLTT